MISVKVVSFLLILSTGLGQEFASDCPEPNGFFADAVQCDKYYACVDGVLSEKLCPDGMVFNDLNPRVENCDFPFQIGCEGRPEMQPPQSNKNCPRLNGYFPHEDKSICNEFYFCAAGIGSHITCPEGLVFSLKTGTCVWPDEAGRTDCSSKKVLNFTCPKESFDIAVAHPRYPDPVDCQFFYVCINGETPRRNGCKFGEVFNSETKSCDKPVNVPDCKDYYKEYFEEYFATLDSGSNLPTPDVLAAAIGSGFNLPDKPKRVKISPGSASAAPVRRRKPVDSTVAAGTPVVQDEVPVLEEPVRTRRPQGQRPPVRSRRPLLSNRRRPIRRRNEVQTTTTTTTTTTPAPALDEYYDYYYDYPEGEVAPAAKPSNTQGK